MKKRKVNFYSNPSMSEQALAKESEQRDEMIQKSIKGLERKFQKFKEECSDNDFIQLNELHELILKEKDSLVNAHFQYLKRSSFLVFEKKLKELLKEIEALKYSLIQKKNKVEYDISYDPFDDEMLFVENGQEVNKEETEPTEVSENEIDLSHYKLSFQNMKNKRIIRGIGETDGSNLMISNLEDCEIIILDLLSSVLIQKIKNCTICIGAVESSVLIYSCTNSHILANTKQLRIHGTSESSFYITTVSSPIIENCNTLTFSKYNLNYNGLEELLEKINIPKNSEKWKNILDFHWQNTKEPSPNFSLAEEVNEYHMNIQKRNFSNEGDRTSKDLYYIENFPLHLKKSSVV